MDFTQSICNEYFDQLNDEEKSEFKKYPIVSLFHFI